MLLSAVVVVVSRKGLQVLLAGWRVGGGRVTVLSTKGPRASRHGHSRTWTACANRCPEVSFPPAGRRQCRSLARPRPSWDCGTHDAENVPHQSQGGYGGTAPAHAPATPPAASLPRQTSEHAFSDWPETGTCLLPLYSRDHLAFLSAFQKNNEDSHFTSLVQACQMHLGQISWDIIHLKGWSGGGERGVFYQPHLGDDTNFGDSSSRREKKGGKEEVGAEGNLLPEVAL